MQARPSPVRDNELVDNLFARRARQSYPHRQLYRRGIRRQCPGAVPLLRVARRVVVLLDESKPRRLPGRVDLEAPIEPRPAAFTAVIWIQ